MTFLVDSSSSNGVIDHGPESPADRRSTPLPALHEHGLRRVVGERLGHRPIGLARLTDAAVLVLDLLDADRAAEQQRQDHEGEPTCDRDPPMRGAPAPGASRQIPAPGRSAHLRNRGTPTLPHSGAQCKARRCASLPSDRCPMPPTVRTEPGSISRMTAGVAPQSYCMTVLGTRSRTCASPRSPRRCRPAEFRLIYADHRGHGRSDKPHDPSAYAMPLRVADAVAVLDRLGIERAHFIGRSWGGRLCFGVGEHAPERGRSLVIGGNQPYAWPDRQLNRLVPGTPWRRGANRPAWNPWCRRPSRSAGRSEFAAAPAGAPAQQRSRRPPRRLERSPWSRARSPRISNGGFAAPWSHLHRRGGCGLPRWGAAGGRRDPRRRTAAAGRGEPSRRPYEPVRGRAGGRACNVTQEHLIWAGERPISITAHPAARRRGETGDSDTYEFESAPARSPDQRRPRLGPRLEPRRSLRAIRADAKMPKTRSGSGLSRSRGDWI